MPLGPLARGGVRRRPRRRHAWRLGASGLGRPGRGLRRHTESRKSFRRWHRPDRSAAVRVIIVEDSALIREGLTRILLDDGMEIVAALSSPEALAETVDQSEPDIVILDIRMAPDFNDEGIRAAHLLRARSPAPGVLLLSQHLDTHNAWELFRDDRGGLGYLLKDRVLDIDEFLDSVRRVAAGGTALDPQVVRQLVSLSEPT